MAVLSGAACFIVLSGAISVPTLTSEYCTRTSTEPRSTIGRGTRATTTPPLFIRICRIASVGFLGAERVRRRDRQRRRARQDDNGRRNLYPVTWRDPSGLERKRERLRKIGMKPEL